MSKKTERLFVECRDSGDYAAKKANAERASSVAPTQKEAIKIAREMNPNMNPSVERVRDTDAGGRDKWRKA